jgi:hypothetical protein
MSETKFHTHAVPPSTVISLLLLKGIKTSSYLLCSIISLELNMHDTSSGRSQCIVLLASWSLSFEYLKPERISGTGPVAPGTQSSRWHYPRMEEGSSPAVLCSV